MEIFFIWIFLAGLVGLMSSDKTIGFWGGFLWSLLLSPVIGLLVVVLSRSKSEVLRQQQLMRQQTKTLTQIRDKPEPPTLIADELTKLKKLVDEGVLSGEEFDQQKAKLLKIKTPSQK